MLRRRTLVLFGSNKLRSVPRILQLEPRQGKCAKVGLLRAYVSRLEPERRDVCGPGMLIKTALRDVIVWVLNQGLVSPVLVVAAAQD
jgi:hypothetical protein